MPWTLPAVEGVSDGRGIPLRDGHAPGRGSRQGGSQRRQLTGPLVEPLCPNAERWSALLLATSDYVRKTGFADVAIGLSGGVDSSLVAVVAVDALGPSMCTES